jgi:hypothetical protein
MRNHARMSAMSCQIAWPLKRVAKALTTIAVVAMLVVSSAVMTP